MLAQRKDRYIEGLARFRMDRIEDWLEACDLVADAVLLDGQCIRVARRERALGGSSDARLSSACSFLCSTSALLRALHVRGHGAPPSLALALENLVENFSLGGAE